VRLRRRIPLLIRALLSSLLLYPEQLEGFQKVQAALNDVCKKNTQMAICRWYWLEEMDFFHMIGPKGWTQALPIL
jgi:hypothetical protein